MYLAAPPYAGDSAYKSDSTIAQKEEDMSDLTKELQELKRNLKDYSKESVSAWYDKMQTSFGKLKGKFNSLSDSAKERLQKSYEEVSND